MQPGQPSLPISALPASIIHLFEAAFSPTTVRGGRPTANDWVMALRGVAPTLHQCSHNPAHYYHWDHCHWCDIEQSCGATFFEPAPVRGQSPWFSPAAQPIPPAQPAPNKRPWYQAPPGGIPPQAPVTPFVPPIQQAAQTLGWHAGRLTAKAWGWVKAKASAYPAVATLAVLCGGIWLLSLIINAFSPPQVAAEAPAYSAPARVAQSAPAPVITPPPVYTPPAQVYTPPAPVYTPPAPAPIPPPSAIAGPLPRVVTPDTPPPPPAPIQPDVTLPALRQPALPQTAFPALRTPGATPLTAEPQFSISRVGPSFDCATANAPLLKLICADDELSRSNLEMMQPLYVLRQLAASKVDLDALVYEAHDVTETMTDHCGIDNFDTVPATVKACFNAAFKKQRADWMARLQGDGLEEASRNIEHHILLQAKLQSLGYLLPTERIDGVYGTDTRAAIISWQTASSLPPTGLLSNNEVSLLLQSQPAANPATEPPAFLDGQRDRRTWETWVANRTGADHDGADWWAPSPAYRHWRPSLTDRHQRLHRRATQWRLSPRPNLPLLPGRPPRIMYPRRVKPFLLDGTA